MFPGVQAASTPQEQFMLDCLAPEKDYIPSESRETQTASHAGRLKSVMLLHIARSSDIAEDPHVTSANVCTNTYTSTIALSAYTINRVKFVNMIVLYVFGCLQASVFKYQHP